MVPRRLLHPPRLILAVFAITGAHPSRCTSPSPDSDPSSAASALPSRNLAAASTIANATCAIRRSGFVCTATLLQLFPDRSYPPRPPPSLLYAVHGLQRPIFSPDARDEVFSPPAALACGPLKQILDSNALLPWSLIVPALSSRGYISVSIGIHSVLDGLKQDLDNLSGVTVFAPVEGGGFPGRRVAGGLHLLPQKLTFVQLSRMRSNYVILPTLVQGRGLQVMSGTSNSSSNKSFSPSEKVEIVELEVFSTKKAVIHGVARVLEAVDVS